jgi:hypothetical protein
MTKCWMCEEFREPSAEHLLQAAAVDHLFPDLSVENPVQWTAWGGERERVSRRLIASSDNDRLTFKRCRICIDCNGTRTSASDESFMKFLRYVEPITSLRKSVALPFTDVYPSSTDARLRQLHGHFAKKLGCMINDVGAGFNLTGLANAALFGRPHPYLFIVFYSVPTDARAKLAGAGPLNVGVGRDGRDRVAEMTLYFESLGVRMVYFADDVSLIKVPRNAWRPDDEGSAWTVEALGAPASPM